MANEKRLIDANALIEKILSLTLTVTGLRCGKGVLLELLNKYRNGILQLVNEQPTVDAVPVVWCKGCEHWLHLEDGFGDCRNRRLHLDNQPGPTMKADDFCSCGERRTDDST